MDQKGQNLVDTLHREVSYANKSNFEKNARAAMLNYGVVDNSLVYKFFTSGLAVILTNTILAPLERVKTVIQTNHIATVQKELKISSPIGVYTTIANDQGVVQFYRGNLANVYKYSVHSFVRIFMYERFKEEISTQGMDKYNALAKNIAVNTIISTLAMTAAYPFDLVHTRMAADMSKRIHPKLYSSVRDCFKKANTDSYISSLNSDSSSMRSIYKGYSLALAGSLPYAILSLPLYDFFNTQLRANTQGLDPDNFSTRLLKRFLPPTLVLMLLSSVLYPLETAKKLSQVNGSLGHQKAYNSTKELFQKTGMKLLYRGYSLHLIKLVPYSFLQYSIYEMSTKIVSSQK